MNDIGAEVIGQRLLVKEEAVCVNQPQILTGSKKNDVGNLVKNGSAMPLKQSKLGGGHQNSLHPLRICFSKV
jgi:hypothetical protein